MTRKEAERYAHLCAALDRLGIAPHDREHLLRIQQTLRRWGERECNGEVETDDEGKSWNVHHHRTANREAGALRRLAKIMAQYPALAAYHQTDPRGCALYVYEKAKMGNRDPSTCYSSVGVAVCFR